MELHPRYTLLIRQITKDIWGSLAAAQADVLLGSVEPMKQLAKAAGIDEAKILEQPLGDLTLEICAYLSKLVACMKYKDMSDFWKPIALADTIGELHTVGCGYMFYTGVNRSHTVEENRIRMVREALEWRVAQMERKC